MVTIFRNGRRLVHIEGGEGNFPRTLSNCNVNTVVSRVAIFVPESVRKGLFTFVGL